ncbi:MAG: serine/threonine protein phosphatase [Proteobacteria bacterium]|nr:MAG: serine/threonine protein phosphatase [Pseudomonadota bacterium]PIE18590.1 MAG: serine/threonine protein phosphatase [Pseudomonadota bacterium]
MRIRYAAKTDVGMKRTHNEDYFSLMEDEQLFIVADGMGGHSSGEVASRMAAETVSEFYQRTKDEEATWPYKMDRSLSYIENRLACGIKLANYKIYEAASKDIRFKGMGTTIVTCLINGDKIYIAHVGDSRCYRVREGKIEQMTRDHSLLEDYKDAKPDMTEEEERNFPHKNVITRALGMRDSVQVDISTKQVKDGDVYLLCSDGLSGMVEDPALERILVEAPDLEHSVAELVDQANRAGGTDNITTLILQCTNVAVGEEPKKEESAAEEKKAAANDPAKEEPKEEAKEQEEAKEG